MPNFDDYKAAVEALSGGLNTVIFDDLGMPSVMFPFVKQKHSDLITGGTQDTFPCFIVDGVEKDVINVSKFENIVVNGRAYSLPMKASKCEANPKIRYPISKGSKIPGRRPGR